MLRGVREVFKVLVSFTAWGGVISSTPVRQVAMVMSVSMQWRFGRVH